MKNTNHAKVSNGYYRLTTQRKLATASLYARNFLELTKTAAPQDTCQGAVKVYDPLIEYVCINV